MDSKKMLLFGVVVIILIAVVAAAALSGGDDGSDSGDEDVAPLPPADDSEVLISWTTTFDTENPDSYYSTPSEGMKFLTVHYTVTNNGYEKGVKLGYNSNLLWEVLYDGVEASGVPTDDHPEHSDAFVMVGETGSGIEMFEVSADCGIDGIDISVESLLGNFGISVAN